MVIAFYGSPEKLFACLLFFFFFVPGDLHSVSLLWSVGCHILKLSYFLEKNGTQNTMFEQGEEENPKEQKLLL